MLKCHTVNVLSLKQIYKKNWRHFIKPVYLALAFFYVFKVLIVAYE